LDQTEDAVEAGMKALEEKRAAIGQERDAGSALTDDSKQQSSSESPSSDSESDFDLYDVPVPSSSTAGGSKSRKRRRHDDPADVGPSKKEKVDYASDVIYEYFTETIITVGISLFVFCRIL
jgi:hypothetical protein